MDPKEREEGKGLGSFEEDEFIQTETPLELHEEHVKLMLSMDHLR